MHICGGEQRGLRNKVGHLASLQCRPGRGGVELVTDTRGEGRGVWRGALTLNAHLSLFVFIRKNNVMCYPRWCEQSFKPMEKTRPK